MDHRIDIVKSSPAPSTGLLSVTLRLQGKHEPKDIKQTN